MGRLFDQRPIEAVSQLDAINEAVALRRAYPCPHFPVMA